MQTRLAPGLIGGIAAVLCAAFAAAEPAGTTTLGAWLISQPADEMAQASSTSTEHAVHLTLTCRTGASHFTIALRGLDRGQDDADIRATAKEGEPIEARLGAEEAEGRALEFRQGEDQDFLTLLALNDEVRLEFGGEDLTFPTAGGFAAISDLKARCLKLPG